MAKRLAFLVLALVALVVLAWAVPWRTQPASTLTPATDTTAAAPAPAAPARAPPGGRRPHVNRVAEDVLVADSLQAAIATHVARRGGDDRQVRSLYFQAKDVCWSQVEAVQQRRRRPEWVADPLRDWAVDELQRRCEGFPENIAAIESTPVPALYDIDTTLGKDAAVAHALDVLRTADNALELIDAGETVLVNDRFPTRALFGGQEPGYPALSSALRNAALLRECELAGRCGADSFATLAYCLQAGCRRGVTLAQALRESLSARDFALVMRIRAWLVAQQAPASG